MRCTIFDFPHSYSYSDRDTAERAVARLQKWGHKASRVYSREDGALATMTDASWQTCFRAGQK